jgi:hypothetical protein
MMQIVKSIKDLEKTIKADIEKNMVNILEKEVFEIVRKLMIQHIKTDVYGVYGPTVYERRGNNQGLIDEDNVVYDIKDNALVIYNIAKYNPYKNNKPMYTTFSKDKRIELVNLIVDGYSYRKEVMPPYARPRPFIENTDKDLSKGGQHFNDLDKAFETGLNRYNITKKG